MRQLTFVLLSIVLMVSCQDDMDQGIISQSQAEILDKYSPESKFVNGNIFGTVTDYGNRPLADAVVTYADETYLTDEEGHFIIRDQQLDANGTFLKVEKEGFFKGFPRFYPSSGATSYVDVELIPHNIIGEFEAASGGVITSEDDLEFQFPPNGIETASGEQYSGTVQVVANYLDPTVYQGASTMPGDLLAVSSDIEEVGLRSFGVMGVELISATGELLQVASDKEVSLSFPVPTDLMTAAPEEISLWSFDEERYGVWIEEGTATRDGSRYVGTVSHFSFWSGSVSFPVVKVSGQLQSANGIPVGLRLWITEDLYGMGIGLFRSSEGFLCGYVPTGARVTFQATELLSSCDFEPVTFGPIMGQLGDSVDLGVINLEANQSEVSLITGTVVDCDGNVVAESQVTLVTPFGKKSFYFDESDFEIQLNNCGGVDRVVIQIKDLSTLQTNQFLSKGIMPVISCGEVVVCNELDCALAEDAFTGPYLLEVEDDVLSFFGLSYPSDVIVNLVEGSDGYGHRVFESIIFPERFSEMQESVGPYLTSFYIDCDKARYHTLQTDAGCGGADFMQYGPSFDADGSQHTEPLDPTDDAEIVLYYDYGFIDSGCALPMSKSKMTLTKI